MKLYIEKGARVDHPPDTVSKIAFDPKANEVYRKSPFSIQAACAGDEACFKTILLTGGKISDIGFICLSKKRKNQVISNIIGAASYHGSERILRYVLSQSQKPLINYPAQEKPDHQ